MDSEENIANNASISNAPEIKRYREYLQIPSAQPDVNYESCLNFLFEQGKCLDLAIKLLELKPSKPILIMSWLGTDESLPSILLNSHMDVVPAYADSWTHSPFSAHIDIKGNIYARGSEDSKCISIQYIEAIRRLKQAGVKLKRTIHLSFMPEEELGGQNGMKELVCSFHFQQLNVGFALDAGLPSPDESFSVFNGEKSVWQILIHCTGITGHAFSMTCNTAGEKLRFIIDKFSNYREQQMQMLGDGCKLDEVVSINLTQIYGGVMSNVLPEQLDVGYDIRLPVDKDHDNFEKMLKKWCRQAGEGVCIEFEQKSPPGLCTKIDCSNSFVPAFKEAAKELNIKLDFKILPGASDLRFLRDRGIPALGFSPIYNTPMLIHNNNEHLNGCIYLRGIEIYECILKHIANCE